MAGELAPQAPAPSCKGTGSNFPGISSLHRSHGVVEGLPQNYRGLVDKEKLDGQPPDPVLVSRRGR